MLTIRQQDILEAIVNEYVRLAEPVSSQLLERGYDFGIHQAMIRREMQELTELGYLEQPHTSAGKVPADKGYRFVVDIFLREKTDNNNENEELWNAALQESAKEAIKSMYLLTRSIAEASSALALGYLKDEHLAWREGWEEILQEPELKDASCINRLIRVLDKIEHGLPAKSEPDILQIYIGEENPFARMDDFSTLIAGIELADDKKGIIAIIGPKRMPYKRNIRLLESLSQFIKNIQ